MHTLSSFASDDDAIEEYAPSDSSFAYGSNKGTNRSSRFLSTQINPNVGENATTQIQQPSQLNATPTKLQHRRMSSFGNSGGGMMATIEREDDSDDVIPIPSEVDENEEFHRVVGHENRIVWLERKVSSFNNFFSYSITQPNPLFFRCMNNPSLLPT